MAKRLSKALRGTRRWIGLIISKDIASRTQLATELTQILSVLDLSNKPRIMDFNLSQISDGRRTGIIEVNLSDYGAVRDLLTTPNLGVKSVISSYTSSGKIKLVRERLSEIV